MQAMLHPRHESCILPLELCNEWLEDLDQLKKISEYICTPVGMADGQKDAPHKAAGMLHQFHFDVPIAQPLTEYRGNVECCCCDMGTELSMSIFFTEEPEDMLPPWIERNDLRSDIADLPETSQPQGRWISGIFMQNCLPIYG